MFWKYGLFKCEIDWSETFRQIKIEERVFAKVIVEFKYFFPNFRCTYLFIV
jgi:hypothetical protein